VLVVSSVAGVLFVAILPLFLPPMKARRSIGGYSQLKCAALTLMANRKESRAAVSFNECGMGHRNMEMLKSNEELGFGVLDGPAEDQI
jgi:hypothetical protein